MRTIFSRLLLSVFFGLGGFYSTPSLANRCEWHKTLNRAECCKASEQALWNDLFKRVECVPSVTGDSCVWDPRFNQVRCCETDEHAVWNPQFNRVQCYRF